MRLSLNSESAAALREFAASMPVAIGNIVESTEKLNQVYQTVQDEVGPHDDQFRDMIVQIKAAQIKAADAINELPPRLLKTADEIDAYVASNPTVGGK